MQYIPLSAGKVAIVCDCHYELVAQYKWSFDGRYAVRSSPTRVRMHRLIIDAPPGTLVDHRDTDRLNNQCSNLRFATNSQNGHNRPLPATYKGAYFEPHLGKWRASMRVGRSAKYLGLYNTAEEAALAYNQAATAKYGEFAVLNIIGSRTQPLPE